MAKISKTEVSELRQKVQDALLKSAIDYYEAERACSEIVVPQSWKDDRNKAYNEFIWRCQDYQLVNDSDNIDLSELNYDYIWWYRHGLFFNLNYLSVLKLCH